MHLKAKKPRVAMKKHRPHIGRAQASKRNGHLHVISPATASEIRKTLGIGKSQVKNILLAFSAAGIDV